MTPHPSIYVPSSVGRAALSELDRVPWGELAHAYGTGRRGPGLHLDVAETLRWLGRDDEDALAEAFDTLFGNVCHQGTIYQATAYTVPFLAAYGAGDDLPPELAGDLAFLLGHIGVASSFEAPHGSHAGSWGAGVGPLTREAFRLSERHLNALARRHPRLAELVGALLAVARTDASDPAAVDHLRAVVDALGDD